MNSNNGPLDTERQQSCRDKQWFTDLYRRHYQKLLTYARKRTDSATADEVVSETFLVAWRRIDDIPEGSETPWLFGVARNVLKTSSRSIRRKQALQNKVIAAPDTDHIENQPDRDPRAETLKIAMAHLDKQDRELLLLSAWEEMSNTTIAARLGITSNAVSIRLHRARKKLATLLEQSSLPATT